MIGPFKRESQEYVGRLRPIALVRAQEEQRFSLTKNVIERRLAGQVIGSISLLDAVAHMVDGARQVTLFFDGDVAIEQISPGPGVTLISARQVTDAPILTFAVPQTGAASFRCGDQTVEINPSEAELAQFEGANALLAVRNAESANIVLDWLAYHADVQGATHAVILDRAKPGTDPAFANALRDGLKARKLDYQLCVVTSDLPLGKPNMPPEAHPFCVPESPGKDRMTIPAPSPWDAPLGAMTWYEIARLRFLADARAVANIDVHDLIPRNQESVFDSAVAAVGALITLSGRHCYPWRVRMGEPTLFADHICIQFDTDSSRIRWCIAPSKSAEDTVWRMVRVGNATPQKSREHIFYRHMALRHPTDSISRLVAKTSLIEHPPLLAQASNYFGHSPVRAPAVEISLNEDTQARSLIVTTMKNEGPFILEWLAYHRIVGFDDFLIYTNDCTDGTDTMLQLLMRKGLVQHRDNKFRELDLRPQHAALQMAEDEPLVQDAKWVTCIDVDEFVNIKTGDGTLSALFAAVPDANLIAMTWRLFGNNDVHQFQDAPITEQFSRCAPEFVRKPHQAWGFKTLFQNIGLFKKLGVHRPKGLNPQLWATINWVNGSGAPMPRKLFRNGWRSNTDSYGYDLVQLNHYAVRSAESFLVKRDRGRVNHVDRDQGSAYWFRMNHNTVDDRSIRRMLPAMQAEFDRLISDPEIKSAHAFSFAKHRAKIAELRAQPAPSAFYDSLSSARLQTLSRMLPHFGANVFLAGPDCVPQELVDQAASGQLADDFFFTVPKPEDTEH